MTLTNMCANEGFGKNVSQRRGEIEQFQMVGGERN